LIHRGDVNEIGLNGKDIAAIRLRGSKRLTAGQRDPARRLPAEKHTVRLLFHWEIPLRQSTFIAVRTVIYPGSFDPLTNGHLDLIHRAATLFDRLVVAVAKSESKRPLFSLDERVALVAKAVAQMPHVSVDSFDGLLVKYVESRKGIAVIRGLRAVSDFEFEFQLALMNRKLDERVETIFMMPKESYVFLSSRAVKEIALLGGDVSPFVPRHVQLALKQKLGVSVQT
jgi:pantetheine-phosphate adenylyltransferase